MRHEESPSHLSRLMWRQQQQQQQQEDDRLAPLASLEDLSVLLTPMSTPRPTPCPSPRSRARWSYRLSSFNPLPVISDEDCLEDQEPSCVPPPAPLIVLRSGLANGKRSTTLLPPELHPIILEHEQSCLKPRVVQMPRLPAHTTNGFIMNNGRYPQPDHCDDHDEEEECGLRRCHPDSMTQRPRHRQQQRDHHHHHHQGPRDRFRLIFFAFILHGMAAFVPWNQFMIINNQTDEGGGMSSIMAKYFVDYKLSPGSNATATSTSAYANYFQQFIGLAGLIPNVTFAWINIFFNAGGLLSNRVAWTLFIKCLMLVVMVILAMLDSSCWLEAFFYSSVAIIVIINMANGVYLNSLFGLVARMPFHYLIAVLIGSNTCGALMSVVSIFFIQMNFPPLMSAIYFLIVGLSILLVGFDVYFALTLSPFYRHQNENFKAVVQRDLDGSIPFKSIFRRCRHQCCNLFLTYLITSMLYPNVMADVHSSETSGFVVPVNVFTPLLCLLTFNVFSVVGNLLPTFCYQFPARWLLLPVILRFAFIPFFVLCNYQPNGNRLWPPIIPWDWAFWCGSATFGLTGGYLASEALIHCAKSVQIGHSSVAVMLAAASIVSGSLVGHVCAHLVPLFVTKWLFLA